MRKKKRKGNRKGGRGEGSYTRLEVACAHLRICRRPRFSGLHIAEFCAEFAGKVDRGILPRKTAKISRGRLLFLPNNEQDGGAIVVTALRFPFRICCQRQKHCLSFQSDFCDPPVEGYDRGNPRHGLAGSSYPCDNPIGGNRSAVIQLWRSNGLCYRETDWKSSFAVNPHLATNQLQLRSWRGEQHTNTRMQLRP